MTEPHHAGQPHGAADHDAHLAHHFETPRQQFDAGKLGMWLFLVTEILFFSGLFVAYAVYRARHPEVFHDAHQYLDRTLGAVNTIVLLFSSLTMAWGVRCAQLTQRRGLVVCLITTLACASFFLGVKAIEYSHKWDLGLFWAGRYQPLAHHAEEHGLSPILVGMCVPALLALGVFLIWTLAAYLKGQRQTLVVVGGLALTAAAFFGGVACAMALPAAVAGLTGAEHEAEPHAGANHGSSGKTETAGAEPAEPPAEHGDTGTPAATEPPAAAPGGAAGQQPAKPSYAGIFFSIYYAMTGVHALHILAGMIAISWLLVRAVRGDFSSRFFGPVDYVGLYWHLVDLVWIYLFPLLYLIH